MRAFFAGLHKPPVKITVEPTDWGFHFPPAIVEQGFREWLRTDFTKMPDPNEIMARDPLWQQDMELAYRLWKFQEKDEGD